MKAKFSTTALLVFLSITSFIIMLLLAKQTVMLQKAEEQAKLLKPGDEAYLFDAKDINDNNIKITKKTTAVLIFYSATCGACQRKNHFWEELYEKYGTKITFVGISINSPRKIKAFVQRYGLTFPVIHDKDGYFMQKYKIKWVPSLVLVSNGKIVFCQKYLQETSEAVESISVLINEITNNGVEK